MTPSSDPNEVEQTLLPGTPATASPAVEATPRPKPTAPEPDTPSHPAASDATVDMPIAPSPPSPPADDPGATLVSGLRHAASSETNAEGNGAVEATILPSSTDKASPVTLAGGLSDNGATLPLPADRTAASYSRSASGLGSDTAPISISVGRGGKSAPLSSAAGTMVGRFALKDLHASGGLGEVFKARDTELNREVAVKRIKSRYADDPGSRRRFLTEAELTARLDHPGVVPVFGLVNDARGRPCYAMRFIRGETLKDEIDRYYSQGSEVKSPGSEKTENSGEKSAEPKADPEFTPACANVPRSVAFRHLLARFLATCQAIAYAHSRNIIHRDIKPANIMVGAFGETLVVDWGLAKSLDDGPDLDRLMKSAAAAGFRHDPETTDLPSHMTMAGTAVGTPAYMAPEQAAGEIDKVGPRADIYALGATLYVILTGKAPVAGKDTTEVLDRVRRGAYDPAATVNPECPKPLDAIARKAMALRPEDRYASALEVAADVERWLSDEPVSCYQDPFFARLARWARRHPARVAAGVSLLVAGVLAAGGIALAIREGEKETRLERDKVKAAQKETDEALKIVRATNIEIEARNRDIEARNKAIEEQNKKIDEARKLASDRYENAVKAYNMLVYDIDKRLTDRAGLQELRKTLLVNATKGLKQLVAGQKEGHIVADRTLVAAYRQMGEVYQLLGDTDNARENFKRAVELAKKVQSEALPGDKRVADRELGRSYAKLAGIHQQAGQTQPALVAIDEAIALFEKLAEDKADTESQKDLAAAKAQRATILMERGKTGQAFEDCKDALTMRQRLFDAAPNDPERKRDLAASLDLLADLQLRIDGTKKAIGSAVAALRFRKELMHDLPARTDVIRELAAAYARLGEVQAERGYVTDAKNTYQEGVDNLIELVKDDDKSVNAKAELAAMYGRLGQVQLRTGDLDEALKNTERGKDIAEKLQQLDAGSATAQRGLAVAIEQYGDALLATGKIDDGITQYKTAAKLFGPLRENDKDSARAKLDMARGLERMGDGLLANNKPAGAIVVYDKSVEIREEVVKRDADSISAKRDLAIGLYKLAYSYSADGKMAAADKYATRATDLFIELVAKDKESAQAQRDIAICYAKWGEVLAHNGHVTGALIVWQSSLDRCEKLASLDAGNMQAKEDEAIAYERLATFYTVLGHTKRALAAGKAAVELWTSIYKDKETRAGRRRLALAMLRCGNIHVELRQLEDARKLYKQAAEQIEGFGSDPLLKPVAKLAVDGQLYVDAVEAGLRNPTEVMTFPKDVQAAALRTVATIELNDKRPTVASAVAARLVKVARTPADKFAIARIYAGCASAKRLPQKTREEYAADAVKYLKLAIDADFRDIELLDLPDWDAVSELAPEFAKVQAALVKKLRGAEK